MTFILVPEKKNKILEDAKRLISEDIAACFINYYHDNYKISK